MGHYIELIAGDMHRLRAFVAEPTGKPQAALVLLQERDQRTPGAARRPAASGEALSGVNRRMRELAQRYADDGFLVVCPGTFGRGAAGNDHGYRLDSRSGWEPRVARPLEPLPSRAVMLDIDAAVAWARDASGKKPVGLMGCCWGGLLAWRAAARPQAADTLGAVVCFHGGGMGLDADRLLKPQVPVQAHLPEGDDWMPAQQVQAFAQAQGQAVDLHLYNAPYGFAVAGGANQRPQAAMLAHQRSLDFLRARLQP